MSRILLLRHGQSTWNADGRWQGQADPPLSALGIAQAESAAARLERVDAVWSSDLERAAQTATILASSHLLEVRREPRVRERDAGEWTGLTRDEIEERFPGDLAARRRPPGFETDDVLAPRVLSALREFAALLSGGTGLVVTHGGVILTVEREHGLHRTPVANLEGRWIEATGTGDGDGAEFALGERTLLVDPDQVAVTHPGQP